MPLAAVLFRRVQLVCFCGRHTIRATQRMESETDEAFFQRKQPEMEDMFRRLADASVQNKPEDLALFAIETLLQWRRANAPVEKIPLLEAEEDGSDTWRLLPWLAGAGLHRVVGGTLLHALRVRGGDQGDALLRKERYSPAEGDVGVLSFLRCVRASALATRFISLLTLHRSARCARGLRDRAELASSLRVDALVEGILDTLWDHVATLQGADAATSDEVHSKFAGAIEMAYTGLDTFFGGLEGVVGPPHPKLYDAMTNEHTRGPGTESTDEFVTGN
jgi:hypothetical protein